MPRNPIHNEYDRTKWTGKNDEELKKAIEKTPRYKNGNINWKDVSLFFNKSGGGHYKSAKQCRERWVQFLDPSLDKNPLTTEEEDFIVRMADVIAHKWRELSELFYEEFGKKKSPNFLKNFYYSNKRRNNKKGKKPHQIAPLMALVIVACDEYEEMFDQGPCENHEVIIAQPVNAQIFTEEENSKCYLDNNIPSFCSMISPLLFRSVQM